MNIFSYEMLRITWWIIIGILFIGFAITNGFDMGVGMLIRLSNYSNIERRIMINIIAPHWDGNQVWLITAGGALFAAFPTIYAALLSSFYIAMILMLASLILRPVSFDYRSKINNIYWRNIWDWGIFIGSCIPPLIIGLIFGNLLQGVPFYIDKYLRLYYNGSFFDLFNVFSLLTSCTSLAMFLTQGGAYLQMRTCDNLQIRMKKITQIAALLTMAAFVLSVIWININVDGFNITSAINRSAQSNPLCKIVTHQTGDWIANYKHHPKLKILPLLGVILPLFTIIFSRKNFISLAFIASSLTLTCIIITTGVTMFPFIMPSSTTPNASLTIWDATSSLKTLRVMTIIAIIFIPIVLIYTVWCYRKMFGKITKEYIEKNSSSLY